MIVKYHRKLYSSSIDIQEIQIMMRKFYLPDRIIEINPKYILLTMGITGKDSEQ